MILVAIPVVLGVLLVGLTLGWKFVFAPLLAYAVFAFATANLRAMVNDGRSRMTAEEQQPRPVDADAPERTVYWCEECGTEVVLMVLGSGVAPRHCGSAMHEGAELLSN